MQHDDRVRIPLEYNSQVRLDSLLGMISVHESHERPTRSDRYIDILRHARYQLHVLPVLREMGECCFGHILNP